MSLIVEALVFDLGGVIVAHDDAVMYRKLASRCEPVPARGAISAMFDEPQWGNGERPIRDLHTRMQSDLGYGAGWETFMDDFCCHLVLDTAMLAFVQALAARHRVMILSNTNAVHWDSQVRASHGDLARIEAYLSHEIGHSKPNLKAFAIVAEKAGIDPARSIFFDDLQANVDAARLAGFQSEVFVSESAL